MNTVKLFGDAGFRSLRVEGEVPASLERAVKALQSDRAYKMFDDLHDVEIEVTVQEDGNFRVREVERVPVTVVNTVESVNTLRVTGEDEHDWL